MSTELPLRDDPRTNENLQSQSPDQDLEQRQLQAQGQSVEVESEVGKDEEVLTPSLLQPPSESVMFVKFCTGLGVNALDALPHLITEIDHQQTEELNQRHIRFKAEKLAENEALQRKRNENAEKTFKAMEAGQWAVEEERERQGMKLSARLEKMLRGRAEGFYRQHGYDATREDLQHGTPGTDGAPMFLSRSHEGAAETRRELRKSKAIGPEKRRLKKAVERGDPDQLDTRCSFISKKGNKCSSWARPPLTQCWSCERAHPR